MRNRLYLVILLLAMVMVSSCNDPVGTITLESPEIPDGARELVIRATDSKDAPLSGFNLQITGPTSVNATVPGSEYVFTNLASGVYTIVITKEGYVGASYQLPVVLPDNPKIDFKANTVVKATQLTPPVPVSNATGGTVQAPGPAASGPRSQPTQVSIPAGAIPGAGTTQVSVTHAPPAPVTQTTQPQKSAPGNSVTNTLDRIPLDQFIFSFTVTGGQAITEFAQPVGIDLSIIVPSAIRSEQFNFVLMSGSGPGATPTNESRPITIDAQGNMSTSILKPGTYKIYATLGLTTATAQSNPFTIGSTSCGLGGSFSFSSPTPGPLGPNLLFLGVVPPATVFNNTVVFQPVAGSQSRLTGVNSFIDYNLNRPSGAQLETYRYPLAQVTTTVSISNCHNSGGS
jgi:hypothetical protein